MTTTKEKRTKRGEVYPPREIREVTKARRAWLAAELERLNAEPNTFAKTVDAGSYQHIVVYNVERVAAKEQIRGTCQYCGGSQAVENDRIVLHGYTRPGDGYTHGRCMGVHYSPAEKDITFATSSVTMLRQSVETATAAVAEILKEMKRFGELSYDGYPLTPTPYFYKGQKRRELTPAEKRVMAFRDQQNLKRACEMQADHIERYVIPQFGKPLTTVLV